MKTAVLLSKSATQKTTPLVQQKADVQVELIIKPLLKIIWSDGKSPFPKKQLTTHINILTDLIHSKKIHTIKSVRYSGSEIMHTPQAKIIKLYQKTDYIVVFMLHLKGQQGIKVMLEFEQSITKTTIGDILTSYRKMAQINKQTSEPNLWKVRFSERILSFIQPKAHFLRSGLYSCSILD